MAILKLTDAKCNRSPLSWTWTEAGLVIQPNIYKTLLYLHGQMIWSKMGFYVARDIWPELAIPLIAHGIFCLPIEPVRDDAILQLPELEDNNE